MYYVYNKHSLLISVKIYYKHLMCPYVLSILQVHMLHSNYQSMHSPGYPCFILLTNGNSCCTKNILAKVSHKQ